MRPPVIPEALPLDPEFDAQRGPAVDAARLTPAALRERFLRPPPWQVEQSGDGRLFVPDRPVRPAAVLIGLRARDGALHIVFTVRSAALNDHAGQISFPGGRVEPDDPTPVDAALREAHEEICLDRTLVDVLGTLPPYRTVSGYDVTPVVGLIGAGAQLHAHAGEVEECFDVPLTFLMDGANHQRRIVIQEPTRRCLYAMEFQGRRRYFIWGATAAMLRNLYRFLLA
jgi:8-oxo-dGTP pyrophosphatase MutT (NUDIX family)